MKKKKKLKKPSSNRAGTNSFLKDFEARSKQLYIYYSKSFEKGVGSISDVLKEYSTRDIAYSLFVSSLWLPNIASMIKHQYILAIYLSKDPSTFATTNRIATYDDFSHFLEEIKVHLPTFYQLEDYVPEPDWGEIKFYHMEKNYKIFYGSDLETPYDFLSNFQITVCSMENEFLKVTGRSPSRELLLTLKFQDDIITGITKQPANRDLPEVRPGYLEVPSEEFWKDACTFLLQYSVVEKLELNFIKRYTIELGSIKRETLNAVEFDNTYHHGLLIPAYFVMINESFIPLLPRRVSGILLDSWHLEYERNKDKLIPSTNAPITIKIGNELHKYLKERLRTDSLFQHISALTKSNQADEIIFSSAFISQDMLILFFIMPPSSGEDILKHLRRDVNKFKKTYHLLLQKPLRLALRGERRSVE
ncbi:MAG: hypothetical protein HY800_00235, partial [Ignavibacteriales bacterium]|nr:hypothetical protein [Ignavibacteriales bacterium]